MLYHCIVCYNYTILYDLPDLDRHGPMGAERADPPAAA